MKKLLPLAVLLTAVIYASGQSPTPTPDDDIVRISTEVIQLDVTVTDAKGKIIRDLRRDEFEIYENGKKRNMSGFTFISGVTTSAQRPANMPAVPGNVLRPENVRRTFALVVDDLSLSFRSAYDTRRALKKFVDEQMQDGDLVAILRTGAGIGALQQFTSDKRLLYAAIERVKWNPSGSGGTSAFAPIGPTAAAATTDDEEETETDATVVETGSGETLDSFRDAMFATGTLGALRFVVSGMAELPGRKSVILFSDGFRLVETESGELSTVLDFLRRLVDTAARSSVVFYTIDARGLASTAMTAEDDVSQLTTEDRANILSDRNKELFDTQDGLVYLARETGGLAFINNNDLSVGVKQVLDDQSYYLIAYEPEDDSFDPTKRQFNKIEVKVSRPGARVRTRSGFFNNETHEPSAAVANSAVNSLERALTSPFGMSGISLRMNAVFGSDAKTGSFVRSLLHIDGGSLKFSEVAGLHQSKIEILAMSFDDNGDVIDTLARGYTIKLKPDAYRKAVKDGFIYNFAFPVKKAGAYQYRVAIRDADTGRVGAASQFIEVPNVQKNVFALSGIVIRSFTADEWRAVAEPTAFADASFVFNDTAVRRIRRNTVLNYGAEVYNARPDRSPVSVLTTKIRVYRDGVMILDGKDSPVDMRSRTDRSRIGVSGAFAVGNSMRLGDHVLQLLVTETQPGKKPRTVSQFIDFEVVE